MTKFKMERLSIQFGGNHIVYLFSLSVEKLCPHQRTELAITKLLRNPKKMNFIIFGSYIH